MRNYTIDINVNTADELAGLGAKVRTFIDELGDGTIDVQLAINPLGNTAVYTQAIGFLADGGEEYYEEDEGEDE
ncbi:hypothetical protein MHZ92_14455 [Sporosarcina sp. ACRSL]|uniref:hypothetical protein n=1 Tax=Sporosarcina sp. ACRSL TaxID=2918215 RepID=UPI001EF69BA1|nr:hypothetical protein [Sporosarcina sp. ACRSL]MCG7345338.1 hypothetical protein [Sporosarcina sp. ACRSL]